MRTILIAATLMLFLPTLATAQVHSDHAEHPPGGDDATGSHDGMDHGAMDHDAMDHDAMDHDAMDHGAMDHGAMDHTSHDHAAMNHGEAVSNDGPPARAFSGPDHAADLWFDGADMAAARAANHRKHGAMKTGMVLIERAEVFAARGHDAFAWDVDARWGGDIDRISIESEGEGAFDGPLEDADVGIYWQRAATPFVDLKAGVLASLEPDTLFHAAIGAEGTLPYAIHFDAGLFLSEDGDLTGAVEAEYDQRITQRLILQPRLELAFAAQDIAERDIASGPISLEAGLRLRYEIVREFAPYLGIAWEQALGDNADIARAEGERAGRIGLVAGIRAWF